MLKDVNVMSHCIRFDDMRLHTSLGQAQAGFQAGHRQIGRPTSGRNLSRRCRSSRSRPSLPA